MNTTTLLRERDGALYAVETFIDSNLPRTIANWYKLTMTRGQLASHGFPITAKLGHILTPIVSPPTTWRDEQGWKYHIVSGPGGERKPVYTDITPIPPPTQRRGAYPLQWHEEAWHKRTRAGLVKMDS